MTRLVVVGDVLLDRDLDGHAARLAPDAPVPVVDRLEEHARPGGAGLAAALAAAAGHAVTLVCALGDDGPGRRVRALLAADGIAVCDLGLRGTTPEKVRVRSGGRALMRLDYGGEGGGCGPLTPEAAAVLASADGVLVSDYGRGVAAEPTLRVALARVRVPVLWDPHPRGPAPVRGCLLVTPNAVEAGAAAPDAGLPLVEARARTLRERWGAVDVCVTLAARGALPSEAVRVAVTAASAFVAAGGAAALAASVRARGGTVVATGGCFDLLHAGHVRTLEAARALGDCLIVCLNSDASVRRLKGPDRPLVGQDDRAAVLAALACVDAVAVFEEDDPRAILRELRPHLWAKGGDYAIAELPEAETLAEWGGRAVLVPYVAGRSTTRLIDEARRRAGDEVVRAH